MIQKIKRFITLGLMGAGLMSPFAVPALLSTTALAAQNNIQNGVCQGSNIAADNSNSTECGNADTSKSTLRTITTNVINIFSIIVGVVAVAMIIWGGFRYITSGGDSGNIGSAKNTIIYAIIGLVVVALSQFIVHFVLNTSTNAVSSQ